MTISFPFTHSFCRGGASEASNNNVDHRLIMSHGRWSSQKSKDLYVEDDIHMKLSASSALGLKILPPLHNTVSFYLSVKALIPYLSS